MDSGFLNLDTQSVFKIPEADFTIFWNTAFDKKKVKSFFQFLIIELTCIIKFC